MHLRFLAFVFSTFAMASAVNMSLPCSQHQPTIFAMQELSYALETNSSTTFSGKCCVKIVTPDPEVPILLLVILPQTVAACPTIGDSMGNSGTFKFSKNELSLSKAQLCRMPSMRYILATNNTKVCRIVSSNDPPMDGTARLFAFSAVSALNLCEPSVWWPGTSLALDAPSAYVYAPDVQIYLPPNVTVCNPREDVVRIIHFKNASNWPALRADVLAAPDASSCRFLYLQDQLAREGDCFSVAAGSHLTISYNWSSRNVCSAALSQSIGFVVRFSDSGDDSSGSSASAVCRMQHFILDGHSKQRVMLITSLCASAGVLFLAAIVTLSVLLAARYRRQRQEQQAEQILMCDNELYEAGQLKPSENKLLTVPHSEDAHAT